MSFHHWMYCGCQCSSARCSRLLLESPTLLGIFSAEIMGDPVKAEGRRLPSAFSLQPSYFSAFTIHVLRKSNSGRACVPYEVNAPFSPTAFGRWKIQFCQAVRRPKIFVSMV